MVENTESILNAEGQKAAGDETPAKAKHFQHTEIEGRFNQYQSSYWAGATAALGLRYLSRPGLRKWWQQDEASGGLSKLQYAKKYAYSSFAGAVMYGITTLYATKTYKDMRNIFAEPLAWEFNKKPEDVGIRDMMKSDNAIIHRTISNYFKYNSRRFAINTLFFLPFIPIIGPKLFKSKMFGERLIDHPETPIDLGVAANALYLSSDILSRRETFFEKLQSFIDHKINHTDNASAVITANDLMDLYARHARDDNPKHPISERVNSQGWKNDQVLFSRMAELMNQTYGNVAPTEKADFTIPKLIYLLGHKAVKADTLEENLAYVELANRYGIGAVKEVATAVGNKAQLEAALQHYPIPLPEPVAEIIENQQDLAKFTGKLAETRAGAPLRPLAAPPVAYTEKTAKNEGPAASAAL